MSDLPATIGVDADGNVWRIFDDGTWSMPPSSTGQQVEPVVFYRPQSELYALLAENRELRIRLDVLAGSNSRLLTAEVLRAALERGESEQYLTELLAAVAAGKGIEAVA